MMRGLILLLGLAGCLRDETVSGFAGTDATWVLTEGPGLPERVTLRFPEPGKIAGQGPCNRYFASQSVPYPWIKIGPVGATRMACAQLPQEAAYFAALTTATLVEVQGDVLILSTEAGPLLVFNRAPPD